MSPPRPPRIPLGLLLASAAPERRAELEGDLLEGYERVARTQGMRAARRWMWRQLLSGDVLRLRLANRARRPAGCPGTASEPEEPMKSRLDGLRRDLGWAWRSVRRRPGLSAIVVATLAIAIGANTAIFTIVDRVLLRPLPYEDAHGLAMVFRTVPQYGFERSTSSYPDYADWKSRTRSFSELAAYGFITRTRVAPDGARRWVGYRVTANLFPVLGVPPRLGRTFSPDDDRPGAPGVVVLSDAMFESRFGGDPGVLDQTVMLDGAPVRVVGVMPPGFGFPSRTTEYWEPLRPDPDLERDTNFLTVIGRLAPGNTVASAQAELARIASAIDASAPDANQGFGIFVEGRQAFEVRSARTALWVFAGAVGLLLLVACANIANLQLSRTLARRREMGVRTALGAGQGRIATQLLTESLLLASIGGVLGLAVAGGLLRVLIALAPPGLPRLAEIGLDGWVLAFTAGVSLVAGIAFGVVPAVWGARQDAGRLVRESDSGGGRSRLTVRIQHGFACGQIAIAIALSIGAGLLVHSFARLTAIEPGFDPTGVLAARIQTPPRPDTEMPPGAESMTREELMPLMMDQLEAWTAERDRFFDDVHDRLAAIDGVQRTALAYALPFGAAGFSRVLAPEGADPLDDLPAVGGNVVSPSYFRALGIPLRAGREFDEGDVAASPRVAIVNQTLAERYWPGESAVGKRLLVGDERRPADVVGVVGDVRQQSLGEDRRPFFYTPLAQETWPEAVFLVTRSTLPTADLVDRIRREVAAVDPSLPLTDISTSAALIDATVAAPRFRTLVLATFGAMALLLAVIGVYGVIAYAVGERTREIGIRMALGAGRGSILGLVLGSGLRLAVLGIGVGVLGAVALTRFLESMLFGVGTRDIATFSLTIALALGVTMLACYLPARRAAAVDPLESLRHE